MQGVSVRSGPTEAQVSLTGAHVDGLTVAGARVIKPSVDGLPTHGGIAVLVPYAGRVRGGEYAFQGKTFRLPVGEDGNAIHGFAKEARWEVEQKTGDSALLSAVLKEAGYPSTLRAELRYTAGPRSFSTACSVTNTGATSCPVVVGFHPYFMALDWKVTSPSTAYRYELRDRYIPTGEKASYPLRRLGPKATLDDCFRASGTVELVTESYRLRLARRRMPYLVVYNGKYAEGESVAIEPYTGLPDAFNNGIGAQTLGQGETLECGYSVTATRPSRRSYRKARG